MYPQILLCTAATLVSLPVFAAPRIVDPIAKTSIVTKQPEKLHADLKGARELFLVVTDGGDGITADWADWMEPVLVKTDGSKIKLTELKPKSAQVGFGKLGVNVNSGGRPLKVQGKPVEFGFGTHAPAMIAFDLPAGIVAFETTCGIDNGGTDQGAGSVQFFVFNEEPPRKLLNVSQGGDGKTLEDRYGIENAKKAMANFTTPAGLKASLFAAEPMIQNPTNIDIDHRGRVWATECVNYRNYMGLRPEGDRVVILEDTNGDGLADKETTFYQSTELTNPLGICVIPGPGGGKKGQRVIVSAAPNVWLLTDTQGTDHADKAQILFKIGGVWNYDHQVHAFSFGPDGKFYFNAGNSITELTWPDGKIVKDMAGNEITNKGQPYRQGMVFRCDIDLEKGVASNVETLGWNFRNNFEVAVDSFGTMWQSDNDDDGNKGVRINYVMDFGNYGYTDEMTGAGWRTKRTNIETEIPKMHWHQNDPGVIPNLLMTGAGSPTGILVNEGTLLGPEFTNQIIHCDAGPRTVRAYPVKPDGAGYTAEMVDILTSTDSWYRPSDCAIAPDGSLYVADWYDPGVGGHAMGDHEKGKIMGRIYRVAPDGSKASAPKFDVSVAEGAIAALSSPNRDARCVAWYALHAMGAKAEPALLSLWKSENPRLRARSLGLLSQIKGRELQHLAAGLKDRDEDVRCFALRLCRELEATNELDFTPLHKDRALIEQLLSDPSAAVRREIALSLHAGRKIEKLWAALAQQHDGKDRWFLESLGIGSVKNEDLCFDTWLAAVGEKWNTPAGRDIVWRVRASKSPEYLARILMDESISANEKPRFLRAFDFLPATPEKEKALVKLATLGTSSVEVSREALARLKGNKSPEIAKALTDALSKAKGTAAFVELVEEFGATGQGQALLDTALAIGSDPAAVEAMKMVLDDRESDPILGKALVGPRFADILNLLGASGSKRGLNRLIGIVTHATEKHELPELRRAAVQALARTQAGAESLVKTAKDGKLTEDLKPVAASALRLVQYASLKNEIDQLFPAPAALGGKTLPPISQLVKLKGDAAKGRAIFERVESSCITCHRVDDKGVDFGPALSEIGSKLPKEVLFDSIINPNAGISMGFETTQLALKGGGIGMGIVRSETNDDLVLALPGGVTQKFAKNTITKREKLTTSMMPSGLNQALTQEDLVNLVDYLSTLKKK
jgi:putative membrane-bound dehydrogenase-like protein